MINLILGIHMLLCVSLIGLVLLQQGKGASMGAAFGGANSQTVFGAAGAGNMLTRITTTIAVCFMVTSIMLVRYYASLSEVTTVVTTNPLEGSVMNKVAGSQEAAKSAAPADAAAKPAPAAPEAPPPASEPAKK